MLFKQRAIDLYLHDWFFNLENSKKALLYRNIKVYFRPPSYLTVIPNIKHRLALTQLRTRNHKLHVKTGSWCEPRSTPFDEPRVLFVTGMNWKTNIMLSCIHSTKIKIYKTYYYQYPSMYKFTKLLTIENKIVLRKLAAYVYYAFEKRNEPAYIND